MKKKPLQDKVSQGPNADAAVPLTVQQDSTVEWCLRLRQVLFISFSI